MRVDELTIGDYFECEDLEIKQAKFLGVKGKMAKVQIDVSIFWLWRYEEVVRIIK